jgi:hypothetical protein
MLTPAEGQVKPGQGKSQASKMAVAWALLKPDKVGRRKLPDQRAAQRLSQ